MIVNDLNKIMLAQDPDFSEKAGLLSEKERLFSEKEALLSQKERLLSEIGSLFFEKKRLLSNIEHLLSNRRGLLSEKTGLLRLLMLGAWLLLKTGRTENALETASKNLSYL